MFKIKDLGDEAWNASPTSEEGYFPPYEEIPAEFKDPDNPWAKVQQRWIWDSHVNGCSCIPRKGVDPKKAYAHCKLIQRAFHLDDYYRMVIVAFLLNEWFCDFLDPDGNSLVSGIN